MGVEYRRCVHAAVLRLVGTGLLWCLASCCTRARVVRGQFRVGSAWSAATQMVKGPGGWRITAREGEGGEKIEMRELLPQVYICTIFVCVYLCTTVGMARDFHAIVYISVRSYLCILVYELPYLSCSRWLAVRVIKRTKLGV